MLKTAQIGLGWWGSQVTQCLQDSDVIEIVCGVDPIQEVADKYREEFGLPVHADYQSVLDDEAVEAVILTTPHKFHEEQVLAAVAAGKQIFCEKPLSLTADSAKRMLDACNAKGIILGLGHERRFEPGWEEIKRLADSGELGTIMHVEADFSHDRFRAMTADNWRATKDEAPASIGMTGMGVHLTDMLLSIVGPVAEVQAQVGHHIIPVPSGDKVSVHLRFANGVSGAMAVVAATPFYARLVVFGSKGWAEARETQHVDPGGTTHFYTRFEGDAEQSMRSFEPVNLVKANFEEWARAATGDGEYRFTNQERLGNVAILEAIARSAETGKPERVAQYE